MNGIVGCTDILLDSELTADQHLTIERLRSCADALMGIADNIMDISRLEHGNMDLEQVPFSLEDLVLDVGEIAAANVGQLPIEVLCDVRQAPPRVVGDPFRMRQVLLNLLDNAVRFTREGEIILRVVRVEQSSQRTRLEFSVSDTGRGIPQREQRRIFESYIQVDGSPTREFSGAGLGLAISSQLVERMGGKIQVSSEVGQGTTFRFDLGFPKVQREDPRTQELLLPQRLANCQVLVLDDNRSSLAIIEDQLARLGLAGAFAASLRQGQALLKERQFDLGLVDLGMPGVSKDGVVQRMQEGCPRLIAMDTRLPRGGLARLQRAGFAGLITKPLRLRKLAEVFQAVWEPRGAPAPEEQQENPAHQEDRPLGRVLLAEDNETNRMITSRLLRLMGFEVEEAHNGEQAVTMARSSPHDLILMDIQMPVMSGLEATGLLRRDGITTPIVALTASIVPEERGRFREAGMDHCLLKPLRRQQMLDVVERFRLGSYLNTDPRRSRRRVLVVTNQPDHLRSMTELLEGQLTDATCQATASGVRACALLGSFRPELVVVDSTLPDVDTRAMVRFIQDNLSGTKIIVTASARGEGERVETLRQMGVSQILPKPVTAARLLTALNQLDQPFDVCHTPAPEEGLAPPDSRPEEDPAEESGTEPGDLVQLMMPAELELTTKQYRKLVSIFVKDATKKLAALKQALKTGDVKEGVFISHSLLGSSATLYLDGAVEPARGLEKAIPGGRQSAIDQHYQALCAAVESLRAALKREA